MAEAAQFLLGTHDFSAFRASQCQAKSPIKHIYHLRVTRHGKMIVLDVRATAFLHHMVRNIAGVLMTIGAGERPVTWAREVLEGRNRREGGVTAHPYGLYLVRGIPRGLRLAATLHRSTLSHRVRSIGRLTGETSFATIRPLTAHSRSAVHEQRSQQDLRDYPHRGRPGGRRSRCRCYRLRLYAKSPRAVDVRQARAIIAELPPFVTTVGLFVNASRCELNEILEVVPLDLLQFHGDETPADCEGYHRPWIKALRVRPGDDLHAACQHYAGARGILPTPTCRACRAALARPSTGRWYLLR